jgi:DNA polymerase-3 subunit alpha
MKPTTFEDIAALNALYRPGPLHFIPEYIARKHKRKAIEYLHPKLKPILENTYGILVYQEQLMQIAKELAGFSLSEADTLRKAVGKKIKNLLQEQEKKFVDGAVRNGVKKEIAQKIWEWIIPFASYGFNKSHSTAYALIAFQTAYLKTHFPTEFMAALLTSEKNDVERIAVLIEECKKMGIEVLPPNINESLKNFTVVPNEKKIRFGLLAIKNVGESIIDTIVSERKQNGPFSSIEDFVRRVNSKSLNKKSLESLIKAGVFDQFEERNKLLQNVEKILEWARENQKNKTNGQKGLFDNHNFSSNNKIYLANASPASNFTKLSWEKELLGLYVSAHPLEDFRKIFENKTFSLARIDNSIVNKKVKVGGIISDIKKIITKNGSPMLFVKLEDLTAKTEVIVFPSIIEKNPTAFQENKIVFIKGRVDNKSGEPKIICEEIEEIINNEA